MTGGEDGSPRPPRAARRLLSALLPSEYHDAVLGDADEEFARRCQRGRGRTGARIWYWRQVIDIDVLRLRAEARTQQARQGGGAGRMDMLLVEMRQALRVFRRNPGFVSAVVVTLAVGIGGTTSIFTLVNGLLLRPIPGIADPDGLAVVQASDFGGAFGVAAYMDYLDLVERSRSFERLAAYKPRQVDAAATGAPEPIAAAMVTSSYFDVLGVVPAVGRFFAAEVDVGAGAHPEVVLTDGLWQRWFASDPDVSGKRIVLNGLSYTVVGVAPPGFRGSSLVDVPEVFVPMTMQAQLMPGSGYLLDRRGWGGIAVVGRLTEGASVSTAASEVGSIGEQLAVEYPSTNGRRVYTATDFRVAALPGQARTPIVQMSALLLGVVTALWLVVCLNVANLFLARSMKRRRELAVRIAMGAGRMRITRQLVLEFMLIAVIAGAGGLVLARLVAEAVTSLPLPLTFDVGVDVRIVLFVGCLALVSGLLCALVPALALSGTDPRSAASPASARHGASHRWPSRILVVSQVTVSVILLFSTALFARTFSNLANADPGFDATNVLTATFDPSLQGYDADRVAAFYAQLTEAAGALPGVTAVTLTDGLPSATNFGSDGWFFQNATDPEQSTSLAFSAVSANFFETMDIPIVGGRAFNEQDLPGRPPAVIVNEATARLVENRTGAPALGQAIGMSGPDGPFLEIVGVVGDSRTGRARQASPFVYGAHAQVLAMGFGGSRRVVMLKTAGDPESLGPDLRRVAAAVDPNVSASGLTTMDRFLSDLLAADRLTVTVLSVSSSVALLLVAVGLYGLLAYVVTQRTREFGIRLALGAEAARLQTLVLREAVGLAGAGIVLGALGALALTRSIEGFLVDVSAADPLSMLASLAAVVLVTLVAAYVPSARAMRSDPVVAMRTE